MGFVARRGLTNFCDFEFLFTISFIVSVIFRFQFPVAFFKLHFHCALSSFFILFTSEGSQSEDF